MNDARVGEFRGFIKMLNEEGYAGHTCAETLLAMPTAAWEGALAAHPEWLRAGTLRSLLARSNDMVDRDPDRALGIARFVVAHVHDVPTPPYGQVLVESLEGEAHTTLGNALLASGNPSAALDAISLAEGLLSLLPLAAIGQADAALVRARICAALQWDDEALDHFDESLRVYAEHLSCAKYARALAARAILLCDMRQWVEAWHTLHHAEETVTALRYDELSVELRGVIEHCHRMGLPTDGSAISPIT
jgi:tetratricopeptide (TPR) repeat protein